MIWKIFDNAQVFQTRRNAARNSGLALSKNKIATG